MDTAEPTDKAALITRQREARIRWETLVDAIPVERVADPALAEGRSVKDVVAHLAAWDEWSADRIGLRLRGEVPPPIGEWEPFEHGFNLRVAAEMRDRPWSAVQQEARSAYDRFAARLEALPETELFGDRPLWPLIRGNGYGHYEDFIAPLRAFVEQIPPALHLTTERLIIRSFKPSDAESIFAMFADPEVVRYLPAMPELTLERSRDVVDRRIARERRNGFGLWVVELKDTGRYIGNCGLAPVEASPPDVELAYHYVRDAWGQGYGTEAGLACLRHGLVTLVLERVYAFADPRNTGSWRIMEKIGMRPNGLVDLFGMTGLRRYVAERTDWEPGALTK